MSILISIALGITLSAACGFRVFIPPLVLSLAANFGHVPLAPSLQWIGTEPALIALATAAIVESFSFCIPGLNNLLDAIAAPLALAAGTLVAAATLTDVDPVLRWTLAIVGGGGSTGIVHSMTTFTRLATNTMTIGLASPVMATMESISAVILSVLALTIPLLAFLLIVGLLWWSSKKVKRLLHRLKKRTSTTP
ncbi:DUF4126 domain-containing protein [Pseudanabaenaceae cyanobacterium LEGE 13415]|nr:DUF4126 domain-containing protein [Pseudanabaenaceae cyanobacterium LEGE 13415]